jgi:hypothetical protein
VRVARLNWVEAAASPEERLFEGVQREGGDHPKVVGSAAESLPQIGTSLCVGTDNLAGAEDDLEGGGLAHGHTFRRQWYSPRIP